MKTEDRLVGSLLSHYNSSSVSSIDLVNTKCNQQKMKMNGHKN